MILQNALRVLAAVFFGLLSTVTAVNASSFIVTIEQEGANVVATGSGSID
jgi:hypothetical protein